MALVKGAACGEGLLPAPEVLCWCPWKEPAPRKHAHFSAPSEQATTRPLVSPSPVLLTSNTASPPLFPGMARGWGGRLWPSTLRSTRILQVCGQEPPPVGPP